MSKPRFRYNWEDGCWWQLFVVSEGSSYTAFDFYELHKPHSPAPKGSSE